MNLSNKIAIFGSTGSIGQSALKVIEAIDGLEVFALSGHKNVGLLLQQVKRFTPRYVVITDEQQAEIHRQAITDALPSDTELLIGSQSLERLATLPDVDVVLAAIVGIAGLPSTYAAVRAGKKVALANKESLVVAGHLFRDASEDTGSVLLPVDSEHSAVFQALKAGKPNEVSRVILTASGGPFREMPAESMPSVTIEQALSHPTWQMGRKISIDSATMMNKTLEIIEAKWLFDLDANQLEVVIHPQSIVHSLVEYVDGSTIAQLSPPDMMLPIQYAFTYPERSLGPCPKLDLTQSMELTFLPPDFDRFPALKLGFEVVKMGGSCGAVLNAANEAAVEAFLNQQIKFTDIAIACREILENHHFNPRPNLAEVLTADAWARLEISKWIAA